MTLHHPTPSTTTLLLVIGSIALVSLFFTVFFQAKEVRRDEARLAGSVTMVATSSLIIIDARGATTTIYLTPLTKQRDITPLTPLTPGDRIMTTGQFTSEGTFIAKGIRRLHE